MRVKTPARGTDRVGDRGREASSGSHSRAPAGPRGGWLATGTLVRKTSRVRPRRLRADDGYMMLEGAHFVKSIKASHLFASCGQKEDRLGDEPSREAYTAHVDHASRSSGVVGPRPGGPSWSEIPGFVSYRPSLRVWRALLATLLGVSSDLLKSTGFVSDVGKSRVSGTITKFTRGFGDL
jgi:hypothetical protein